MLTNVTPANWNNGQSTRMMWEQMVGVERHLESKTTEIVGIRQRKKCRESLVCIENIHNAQLLITEFLKMSV
jgi:hypothetical protein